MAPDAQAVIQFIKMLQTVFAVRIAMYVGLIASIALFGAALWFNTWERAATASAFAVLVFWPLVRADTRTQKGE